MQRVSVIATLTGLQKVRGHHRHDHDGHGGRQVEYGRKQWNEDKRQSNAHYAFDDASAKEGEGAENESRRIDIEERHLAGDPFGDSGGRTIARRGRRQRSKAQSWPCSRCLTTDAVYGGAGDASLVRAEEPAASDGKTESTRIARRQPPRSIVSACLAHLKYDALKASQLYYRCVSLVFNVSKGDVVPCRTKGPSQRNTFDLNLIFRPCGQNLDFQHKIL